MGVLVEVLNYAPSSIVQQYIEIFARPPEYLSDVWAGLKDPPYPRLSDASCNQVSQIDHAEIGARTTPGLWRRVHYFTIWEEIARQIFTPGYVFPTQKKNDQGECYFRGRLHQNPNMDAFLALDRKSFLKYRHAFYKDNTWVIDIGHQDTTVSFLDWIEDNYLVKSVHLSISKDDAGYFSDVLSWIEHSMKAKTRGSDIDNVQLLELFAATSDQITDELYTIWWSKFDYVTHLPLEELTLDLMDAYVLDGMFLPNNWWLRTLPRFRYGTPRNLRVLVRTLEIQSGIKRAFAEIKLE